MSTPSGSFREKRKKQPSRRLTENNAAIPELSSHRESVAVHAQATAPTAEAPDPPSASTPSTVSPNQGQPNQDVCDLRSESDRPGPSQPTAATGSRSNSTMTLSSSSESSDSEDSMHAAAKKKKKKPIKRSKRKRRRRTSGESNAIDENGMYKDVEVMEISSGEKSEIEGPGAKNKKNPTADIDQFFDSGTFVKGEKRGRRRCKACA
jgi:hypothetical protein